MFDNCSPKKIPSKKTIPSIILCIQYYFTLSLIFLPLFNKNRTQSIVSRFCLKILKLRNTVPKSIPFPYSSSSYVSFGSIFLIINKFLNILIKMIKYSLWLFP